MNTIKKMKGAFYSLAASIVVLSLMSSSYAADEPTELPVLICPKRIHDNRINKKNPDIITWENIRLYIKGTRTSLNMKEADKCIEIGKVKTDSKDQITVTFAPDKTKPVQTHLYNITMMENKTGGKSDTVNITGTDYKVTLNYGVLDSQDQKERDVKGIILQDLYIDPM